jgi:ABC-type transporter Mla MlaB component
MTEKEDSTDLMRHDPLADLDSLPTAADDFLGLGDDFQLEDELQGLDQIEQEVAAAAPESVEPAPASPETQRQEHSARSSEGPIDLGEALTIREVGAMQARLLQALIDQSQADYQLSAADLQQIDGAGVQMLVAFVQEASRRGCGVSWQTQTEVLRQAAASMGLSHALRLS